LRKAVEAATHEASLRLRAEVGFGARPRLRIAWILDASGGAAAASAPESRAAFFRAGHTRFGSGRVEVVLPAHRYLRLPETARSVVAHESAHAFLAADLGDPARYDAVPLWFREGLALWFSGEGRQRLDDRIAFTTFSKRPAPGFLVGTVRGDPGSTSRLATDKDVTPAEAYLVFEHLRERVGASGVRAIVERILQGLPFDASLESVVAADATAFASTALEAGRRVVRKRLTPAREAVFHESLQRRVRGGEAAEGPDSAAATWRRLLESEPRGPLRTTLQYLLARHGVTRLRRGELQRTARAELLRDLEALAAVPESLWRPEVLLLLGEVRLAEARGHPSGETRGASACWLEALEVYPEDGPVASRARLLLSRLEASRRQAAEEEPP